MRIDLVSGLDSSASVIADDDFLPDLGFDSTRVMTLVERWNGNGATKTFATLADQATLAERAVRTSGHFFGYLVLCGGVHPKFDRSSLKAVAYLLLQPRVRSQHAHSRSTRISLNMVGFEKGPRDVPMNRAPLAVLRLALGLLVCGAIGQQLKIHVALQYNALNFFSYFTNLSNLLAAGVLVAGAMRSFRAKPPSPLFDQLRFMSVVNMTIVGIVFALLLRNVDLGSLLPWINTLLHYVMPVAVLVDWFVDPPHLQLTGRHLSRVLIVPTVYLAYVLIRGGVTDWYPYPFLNPANVGGYGGVGAYALGITAVFVLSGWVLMKAGTRRASSIP